MGSKIETSGGYCCSLHILILSIYYKDSKLGLICYI